MEQEKELHRMGRVPVKKLMISMGVPMVLSMMLQALYNIVDSAFVSNMKAGGEAALNALTLAFPMQMLMVAVGIGTGVGVNALVARSLGQKNREKASRTAGNGVFLALVFYGIFLLFGLFGARAYVASQTQNPVVLEIAVEYLTICCVASAGILSFSIYEKLLQAAGHSLYSTIAQVAGAVTNIILDPIMIYGLLGCPEMGVAGAAWATVIGQCVSWLLALLFHKKVNKEIASGLRYWKPSGAILKEIYAIGLPAILAQALMSLMTYGLNLILVTVSEAMVTAYGLYYKIQQFLLFAAFGLRDAITPITAFGHGMKSRERVDGGIRYGLIDTLLVMLAGTVLLEAFAVPLAGLFGLSGETEALCVSAIGVISLSFVFAGANIAMQGVFQALGGGLESLAVSVCRQALFVFPPALLFAAIARTSMENAWMVWLTFPIAEVLTAGIAALLLKRIYKAKVLPLEHVPVENSVMEAVEEGCGAQ